MKRTSIILAAIVLVGAFIGAARAADEITVTAVLAVKNGNFDLTRTVSNYKVTQTGTAVDYGIRAVALGSTNALPVSNVTDPGYCFIRNQSASNDVYVSVVLQLKAGDVAIFPAATTNITTYSLVGTNNLEYWVNQK